MGAGGDGAADLGQVQREGLGVGAGSTRRGGGGAGRADGAEDVGPFEALVAGARGRVPRLAQIRVRGAVLA